MQNESEPEMTLGQIEGEVLAEGREWTRQRLEQKLRERADRIGRSFFPAGATTGALSKEKAHAAKQRGKRAD
jgi:hypothetical protein